VGCLSYCNPKFLATEQCPRELKFEITEMEPVLDQQLSFTLAPAMTVQEVVKQALDLETKGNRTVKGTSPDQIPALWIVKGIEVIRRVACDIDM
jgi:hypothetical protein